MLCVIIPIHCAEYFFKYKMDVGLDEIIKKKWKKGVQGKQNRNSTRNLPRRQGKKGGSNFPAGGGIKKVAPILDARAKIIARQRSTLRDAREKLNSLRRQQDARIKLSSSGQSLGSRLGSALSGTRNMVPRRTINNLARQPRPAMDTYAYGRAAGRRGDRLYRTIDNDLEPMEIEPSNWDPATLPQLEVTLTRPAGPPPFPRQRELRREDGWLKPSVLRRDDGIKSRLEPIRQEEGYRIVVSNLQPTVTHEDIKELFEDIGPLIGSRVVRPGTAEVVYRDFKDAVAAVDTYHNRQLDGQPMKCLLVKPASSGSKGMVGTKGSVVPDISTIHKALFMK